MLWTYYLDLILREIKCSESVDNFVCNIEQWSIIVLVDHAKTSSLTLNLEKQSDNHILGHTKHGLASVKMDPALLWLLLLFFYLRYFNKTYYINYV